MESATLSLRQRKLLNLVQNHTSHITGQALAKQLGVSPRTIRSDIVEINRSLAACNAQILSRKSKGYYLECLDPTSFQELFKTDDILITREDRIRYLSFQLCLSEIPLNQYDLEDEMFISKTTLENDIASLKRKYVLSAPHIQLLHEGDFWSFEKDESKRRALLNQLFHSDWNYNTTGNAYYSYSFLNSDIMSRIIQITSEVFLRHNFQIEDPNLVTLNLALGIMYYRIMSGNLLPESDILQKPDEKIKCLNDDLFVLLEESLSCTFPPQEKEAIYLHLQNSELLDANKLTFQTAANYFTPTILEIADTYIQLINDTYHLDFSQDEDFYITLLQYLRYLSTPEHVLNSQGNIDLLRRNLLTESEIAYIFQPLAVKYFGNYLEKSEMLYLTFCISGALENYRTFHPEQKLRTVICCHLNLPAIWSMKRKILGAFANYMDIVSLLPIYARSSYDFSDVDLVLTTVKKTITDNPGTLVLQVKPDIAPQDYSRLQEIVSNNYMNFLYKNHTFSLANLISRAYWHNNLPVTDRLSVIETLSRDFIDHQLVNSSFTEDLLRRESTYPFCYQPGVLFLYSLEPATNTQLSIATFSHRILWNSYKIRVVIMGCFARGDETLLLKLLHEIYVKHENPDFYRYAHSQDEFLEFFTK